jgi:polysaccharide export outer membrane protein
MNMKLKFSLSYLVVFVFFSFSCNRFKNIPYYQDLDHLHYSEEAITNPPQLKFQVNDLIGVHVSCANAEAATIFNAGPAPVGSEALSKAPLYGYRVNAAGEVRIPLVGVLKVDGLTTDEFAKQLTDSLKAFLKEPIVSIRLLNFKISVMGDVPQPDIYTIQNEHINVNEALALAGDLTITAKRTNVLLIRELSGKRQFFPIDLTKKDIFNQPYYYLNNNDILLVEPNKSKLGTIDKRNKNTSVFVSAFSAIAIILSAILINRR